MNIRNINLAAASSNIINPAFGAMRSKTDAEMLSMLGTKPGGAVNMELWSARNSTANPPTYTRNPNLWCNELVSQLTAAVAYKDDVTGGKQSYGGILISPRHVLYCDHAHPFARNTWFVNYNSTKECKLHFVLANGSVVEAVQIAQTTVRSTRDRPGAYTPADWPSGAAPAQDLCVAVLDRDVQALGVHVMPIPKLTLQDLGYIATPVISHIHVTQGYERTTSIIPPTPRSDYPQYHNSMVAVGYGGMSDPPLNSTLKTIDYAVWNGDSGTPSMILLNGKLYLHRLIGASNIPNNIGHINAMIAVAEDDAISRGRLAARTGITVPLVPVLI